MARRSVAHVTLMSAEGEVVQFPVGTSEADLPGWAKGRITNPAVWDGPDAEAEVSGDSADPELRAPKSALVPMDVPPKSGSGSSVAAWVEYALAAGVVVDDSAKRDDVIAACEAAGVPTE